MRLLFNLLEKGNLKLAVAESLTAGKVQDKIAKEHGISAYFQGGITAYTCEMKQRLLRVDSKLLEEKGPYNFETTRQMCYGVMKVMKADVALATSGVAGPGDDGVAKEGIVYITVKIKDEYFDFVFDANIKNDREKVREEAAEMAIHFLISCLWNYLEKNTADGSQQ